MPLDSPQDVLANQLPDLLIRSTSPHHSLDEGRIVSHRVDTIRNTRKPDSIKIPTDADMVPASNLNNMHDVINHRLNVSSGGVLFIQEVPHKHNHKHAPILPQPHQHIIRRVSVDLGQLVARAVAEDNRRLSNIQHIAHRLVRHMRQVHHHAQTIHLRHSRAAERAQPSVLPRGGDRRRGRGERVVAVVREGDVPHAQVVKLPDDGDRSTHLVQALRAEHGGDLASFEGGPDARRRVAELELGRRGDEAPGDVDLLQGIADGVGWVVWVCELGVALDEDGPELAA